MSKDVDWSSPDMRAGAVDFAKVHPSGLAGAAEELGMDGEGGRPSLDDLKNWVEKSRQCKMSDAKSQAVFEEEALRVDEVPEGAMPRPEMTPLQALLSGEKEALRDQNRKALIAALENTDAPLTYKQRKTAVAMLRGSDTATRRDLVLGLLRFIVGDAFDEVTTAWKLKEGSVTLSEGFTWEQREAKIPLRGAYRQMSSGRVDLVILNAAGVVEKHYSYARVRRVRVNRTTRTVYFRQQHPTKVFARACLAERAALLLNLVGGGGRMGKDFATLFGRSQDTVSHHNRKLLTRLMENTGSKVGLRGLETVPKPKPLGPVARLKIRISNRHDVSPPSPPLVSRRPKKIS